MDMWIDERKMEGRINVRLMSDMLVEGMLTDICELEIDLLCLSAFIFGRERSLLARLFIAKNISN